MSFPPVPSPGPDPENGLVRVKLTSLSEEWPQQSRRPWTTEYQEAIVSREHYRTRTNAQNIMLGEEYLSVHTVQFHVHKVPNRLDSCTVAGVSLGHHLRLGGRGAGLVGECIQKPFLSHDWKCSLFIWWWLRGHKICQNLGSDTF